MSILKKFFNQTKDKKTESKLNPSRIEIDLSKVYPRLKKVFTIDYPDTQPNEEEPELTLQEAESPISRSFAHELAIFYGIDTGYGYQLLQNRDLSNEITIDKIHDAALANMARSIADTMQVQGDPKNVMMLTNGGNFEATMMMTDFLWEQLQPVVNDTICVAIPAKDLLFIAAKNNPAGRESLRKWVRFYFDENDDTPGLTTRHIYERTETGWKLLETA
jgi:uncharacterized protein YtpQ (UPF0354 family)